MAGIWLTRWWVSFSWRNIMWCEVAMVKCLRPSMKTGGFRRFIRNYFFASNPIDWFKSEVVKQFYWLGLVTIPCNNQDYFKIMSISLYDFLFWYWQKVRLFWILCVSIYILFSSFAYFLLKALETSAYLLFQFLVNELTVTFSNYQHASWLKIWFPAIYHCYEHTPW